MAAVWNIKDLRPPPHLTYEIHLSDINADDFISVCSDAILILNKQEALHVEAATLSRLLYRMKSKLRCDKGLKFMAKVNRGLLCYLSMDLAAVFDTIKPSSSDSGYQTMCAPSRQMLQWVLVRTQGFARLFCQVIRSCQDAAFYMKCRLHLGHMWDIGLISLGIVSRIWTISKYLVLCACEWYRKLKPYLSVLEPVGIHWLPADYHFPADLRVWLDVALLTNSMKIQRSDSGCKKQHRIFDLIEVGNFEREDAVQSSFDNEIDLLESNGISPEIIAAKVSAEVNEPGKAFIKQTEHFEQTDNSNQRTDILPAKKNLFSLVEDVGEPVSSSILPPHLLSTAPICHQKVEKLKKKEKRTLNHSEVSCVHQIKHIKTAHDLIKFLSKELKLREEGSRESLTSELDKLQWHMLHKVLNELICRLKSENVVKGSNKYKKIIKRARKEILVRTQ